MVARLGTTQLEGEPRFFLLLSLLVLVVVICGFGLQAIVTGVPLHALSARLQIHGSVFLAWCVLAVIQPLLISMGVYSLHRGLGWLGAGMAVVMTVSGIAITAEAVAQGAFAPMGGVFLMVNSLTVLAFLGLVVGAIAKRRDTDWHRRLLMSASIVLTEQAWSRILPTQIMGPFVLLAILGAALALIGIGMAYDIRTRGRIHRAWLWGAGCVALPNIGGPLLGFTPPIAALVDRLSGQAL